MIREAFLAIGAALGRAHEDGTLNAAPREGAWRKVGVDEDGNALFAPPSVRSDPWATPWRRP
jgi:hypothetical protein